MLEQRLQRLEDDRAIRDLKAKSVLVQSVDANGAVRVVAMGSDGAPLGDAR